MPLDFPPSQLLESVADRELVMQAQAGDFDAFEELVRRHQGRVYAVALGMLKNASEAEEVTQDTFLSAFQSLDNFRQDSAFFTWVYRVATNHCLMRLRKKRPEARGDATDVDNLMSAAEADDAQWARRPDAAFVQREFTDALDEALETLPDDARAVLLLRAFDGLTMQEIAELLQLTIPAVKSRLHRARLVVREALDDRLGLAA